MTFHEFRKVKEKDRQGHFKNKAPKKRKVNENKDLATAKVVTIKVGLMIYRKDSTSTVSYVGDNPPPLFFTTVVYVWEKPWNVRIFKHLPLNVCLHHQSLLKKNPLVRKIVYTLTNI